MPKRGWSKMDHDEKLEALKDDLDKLYDRVDAHERTMEKLVDDIDRSFKRLGDEIFELKQSLARK
jgi:hypothetical protein